MVQQLLAAAIFCIIAIFIGGLKATESTNELLAKSAIAASIDIFTEKADEPKWRHNLGKLSLHSRIHLGPSSFTPNQVAEFIFKVAKRTILDPNNPDNNVHHLDITAEEIIGKIEAKLQPNNADGNLKGGEKLAEIFKKIRAELANPIFLEQIALLKGQNKNFPSEAMKIAYFYYRFYVALIMDILNLEDHKYIHWLNELLKKLDVSTWPWSWAPGEFWKWQPASAYFTWKNMLAKGPHKPELGQLMNKEGTFGDGIKNEGNVEEENGGNEGNSAASMFNFQQQQQQQQQMMLDNAVLFNNNMI